MVYNPTKSSYKITLQPQLISTNYPITIPKLLSMPLFPHVWITAIDCEENFLKEL